MKTCENCGKDHTGEYGSGRFCSLKCSRGFSTKGKRSEINKKVSAALSNSGNTPVKKSCKLCKNEFAVAWNKRRQMYCSSSCAAKDIGWKNSHSKISKSKWSEINKRSYALGKNRIAGGTTKWLNYKDIKVQGTYELAACKKLDLLKERGEIFKWEYAVNRISYIGIDRKKHTYLIDFTVTLPDGSIKFIEVKGRETDNDKLKWNAVREAGHTLEVWRKFDLLSKVL